MYLGRIVEERTTDELFNDPGHPYTSALLSAVSGLSAREEDAGTTRGEVPDGIRPPSGCHFHPRCPAAFEPCGWDGRDLRELLERRWTEVDADTFERERSICGDLERLEDPGSELSLIPKPPFSAVDVMELLETMKRAMPDERIWTGIERLDVEGESARVVFRERRDPSPTPVKSGSVACHLHDLTAVSCSARRA
jgi:peptide/nickel transport system ATP-binding protein